MQLNSSFVRPAGNKSGCPCFFEFTSFLCFVDVAKSDFGDDAASEWGAEAFGYLHGGEIRGDWGG
jgi:hypothetical protein